MEGQKNGNNENENTSKWTLYFLEKINILIQKLDVKYDVFKSKYYIIFIGIVFVISCDKDSLIFTGILRYKNGGSQKRLSTNFLNNIKMKNLLILASMLLTLGFVNAQKVYSVNYESQADVKIYVVKYESQADLKVYKVKYQSQVGDNDGKWFFTDYSSQAKKKVYFVEYESQADLKIYFVDYESQAGWRNSSKKWIMY